MPENAAVYAQECLDWCQVLRDSQVLSPEEADEELCDLESVARDFIAEHKPANPVASLQLDNQHQQAASEEDYKSPGASASDPQPQEHIPTTPEEAETIISVRDKAPSNPPTKPSQGHS